MPIESNFFNVSGSTGATFVRRIGAENTNLNRPRNIVVKPSTQQLLIVEDYNVRVSTYNINGTFASYFFLLPPGIISTTSSAFAIALDINENIFISFSSSFAAQLEIIKYSPLGVQLDSFMYGGATYLYLAIANNGDVYISDTNNLKVVVYNSTWSFKFQVSSSGPNLTQLVNPSNILINNNLLYIIDAASSSNLPQRIQVIDLNGNYMHNISYAGNGSDKSLQFPAAMGFLNDGTIVVLSTFFSTTWLHFFNPNGTFLQYVTFSGDYSSSSMGVFNDNLIALYNNFGVQTIYNITYYQIGIQVPSNISTNSTSHHSASSHHNTTSSHKNSASSHHNTTSSHKNATSSHNTTSSHHNTTSSHHSNHTSSHSGHSQLHGTSSVSFSVNLLIPVFIQFIILGGFVVNHD